MKAKIKVYEDSLSDKVIHEFNTTEELFEMNETENWFADQISINGNHVYGWDEIEDFC